MLNSNEDLVKNRKYILGESIYEIVVRQKKFLLSGYTASDLKSELRVNARSISEAVKYRFNTNFRGLINYCRVRASCDYLANPRYSTLTMEEIGLLVGYESRQAFYPEFYKIMGETPRSYRNAMRNKNNENEK